MRTKEGYGVTPRRANEAWYVFAQSSPPISSRGQSTSDRTLGRQYRARKKGGYGARRRS